jgi:hypothetical protein
MGSGDDVVAGRMGSGDDVVAGRMGSGDEVVARALGYPFPREPGSFCWRDGRVETFDGDLPGGAVPVVAHGSNASPEHLARKFGDLDGIVIPTIRATLLDHDVVYAPQISHYGSIPATLAPSPGTTVHVWVQYLCPRALERMDETEGVPGLYVRITGMSPVLEDASRPEPAKTCAYLAVAGALKLSGQPVALTEVPALGRRFSALTQSGVQEAIRKLLDAGPTLDDFIRENVEDAAVRKTRSRLLGRT